jgi:hypothetical protein
LCYCIKYTVGGIVPAIIPSIELVAVMSISFENYKNHKAFWDTNILHLIGDVVYEYKALMEYLPLRGYYKSMEGNDLLGV